MSTLVEFSREFRAKVLAAERKALDKRSKEFAKQLHDEQVAAYYMVPCSICGNTCTTSLDACDHRVIPDEYIHTVEED